MTPASRYPFGPRGAARYLQAVHSLVAQHGGDCWPLDESEEEIARTGVAKSLTGAYPGAVSGATYYNQVVVTGTLNPDATGTYTVAGVLNGVPYWTNGVFYLSYQQYGAFAARWRITSTAPGQQISPNPNWYVTLNSIVLTGAYTGQDGATGTATVTAVPASGIYRFDPSGVTFGQQGPLCAGQYAGAAGFAAGNISVGGVLLDPSTAFSFCSWVNCTAPAGATEQVVFASAASSAKRFTLSIASGNLRAAYNDGSTTYAKSGAISTGWNFVALGKDAGNAAPTLWINGVAQAGTTAPTFANTVDTVLSQRTDKTQGLTGSQFAPAIFKAAIIAEVANTLRLTATQGD